MDISGWPPWLKGCCQCFLLLMLGTLLTMIPSLWKEMRQARGIDREWRERHPILTRVGDAVWLLYLLLLLAAVLYTLAK